MDYAEAALRKYGQVCTIRRTPPITSYLSMKRSSKSGRDLGLREAFHEGLILGSVALHSGEVFEVGNDKYLVQSAVPDQTGETFWFAVKTNAVLTHQRYTEDVDDGGNIVQEWVTLNADVSAFGEVITARLRQEDPGLLDSARYIFQVPKSIGVVRLDRFVFDSANYQVESVDDIALAGVFRVQLGVDVR